ncbi:YbhB/YbcL family Raf kinase inhibitor-like protein [Thiolapillus brandeum]|uniref:Phospholipid-binding protein n=1 Tax=Thiolapillus brandeum TaxID=1076588 RepID=A0A7U6GJF5_9GAMM|nr:YbhB/YbcL family Raf kinase inhibitor-like protein [Thiolapillus brandeum]BAO44734.1 phospholipid-binding protein [Thiolapillus brandeum]
MNIWGKLLLGSLLAASTQASLALEMQSPDVSNQVRMKKQQEYKGFGCDGGNISPTLRWKDIPSGTKSFALTIHDPDAPRSGGWWHWVVFNIPRDTRILPANAGDPASGLMPKQAVQSKTDFGVGGYGGPCPPKGHGIHHYNITLHALDVEKLPLKADTPAAEVKRHIDQHRLADSTITGLYSRK